MGIKPLEGIRVVELGTQIVVPIAARMMADWGAEVIKIEPPGGEQGRTTGRLAGIPQGDGENVMYAMTNTGKEMISLNLKTDEGKEVLFRLLEDADVFMSNVRWGAIQRMGLDYECLHKRFPELVYLHFTGFGYEGPDAGRPGQDNAAFFASTGLLADYPQIGDRPMMSFSTYGDTITASSVLSGILAALRHRDRTGEGLRVTTSLYASGLWCNYYNIIACQEAYGNYQMPRCAEENTYPLAEIYQCSDGRWILISATQTDRLMRALELDELVGDERFATYEGIVEHHEFLFRTLTERFLTRTSEEWGERLSQADIIYQKLIHAREIGNSQQAWANGYLTRVQMVNGINAVVPNSPVQFYGWDRPAMKPAHSVGQDTQVVLERLGYSAAEIDVLLQNGTACGPKA